MAIDYADYTSGVNITGGSVAITGIATVSISGTVPVSISGTPNVSISGTVPVSISSGSVSITGTANINILSQSVQIVTQQAQVLLGSVQATLAGGVGIFTPSAGTHGLAFRPITNLGHAVTRLVVDLNNAGSPGPILDVSNPSQNLYVVPWIYADSNSGQVKVTVYGGGGGSAGSVDVVEIHDSESVFVNNTAATPIYVLGAPKSPLGGPNQVPVTFSVVIANTGVSVLVAAVAGQIVYGFELYCLFDAAVAGTVLLLEDTAGNVVGFVPTGVVGPHKIGFFGGPISLVGNGFRLHNTTGGNVTIRGHLVYSQY
jgi:hypothetical protein